MEHIVQIGIGVDDVAIRKHIIETAEAEIKASIKQDVLDNIFDARYYYGHADPKNDPLKQWVRDFIKETIEEYKDDIISKGVQAFAQALMRTKAVKGIIADIVAENQNNGDEILEVE